MVIILVYFRKHGMQMSVEVQSVQGFRASMTCSAVSERTSFACGVWSLLHCLVLLVIWLELRGCERRWY